MKTINSNTDFRYKISRHGLIEMILTSIVNNEELMNSLISDIEDRFKTKLDKDKLEKFLNTVDVTVDKSIDCY